MKINKMILGILILFGISSCDKEITLPHGTYLSKVIYNQNIDQIRHYHYNNQGLLSKREFQFDNMIMEGFDYKYKGELINQIDFYEYRNETMYKAMYALIEYQSQSIVKSTFYPFYTSHNGSVSTYEFDNNNRVEQVSSQSKTFVFLYDNRDNINEVTIYDHANPEYDQKLIYEYDTARNPFYNLDPIHDGYFTSEIDFIHFKCPNNPAKRTSVIQGDTLSISEFIYKYNENDLPIESNELLNEKYRGYDNIQSINHKLYVYEIK